MLEAIEYLILIAFSGAIGAVIGFVYSIVALQVWFFKTIFIGLVKLSVLLIEWADDYWYQFEIADRPLLRGLVIFTVGCVISIALLWLGYFFNGTWVISIFAVVIDVFAFILGVIADPDKAWTMPHFPTLGKEGANVALNL